MPVIIDYIIKLNICLAVVYLFYQLFLRRLTFYNWNRLYLLGYTVLSFIIPLIDIMPSLQKRDLQQAAVMDWIPVINFIKPQEQSFLEALTYWDWAIAVLVLGSIVLLIKFLFRFYAFRKMKTKAQLISDEGTKIYQLNDDITPFSFGNTIFINTDMHPGEELEEIIRHEFVHVKQKHTIDILWCELLCILNWFNPFVWMLRHNVKQNLEFIADNIVLQNGLDKKEYQYLLLKVMGNAQFAFTNHFNFSSLKKRIAMMNTIKTAKVHLIKFMFLLPVVAVLLLSFRKEVIKSQHQSLKTSVEEVVLSKAPFKQQESHLLNMNKDTVPENKKLSLIIKDDNGIPSSKKPLIVLDGELQPDDYDMNALDPSNIESVEVLKDASGTSLYGGKGANGVISIKTKSAKAPKITLRLRSNGEGKNPLIIMDGLPLSAGKSIDDISPDQIESITVLKNEESKAIYGPAAIDGVIIITTKVGHKNDRISFSANGDKVLLKQENSGKTHLMEADNIIISDNGKKIVGTGNVVGTISPDTKIVADTLYFEGNSGNGVPQLQGKVTGQQVRPTSAKNEVVVVGYGTKKTELQGKVTGVQLKPASKQEVVVVGYPSERNRANTLDHLPANAYYVINGAKAKKKDVEKLASEKIASIDVLKGENAVKYYGTKAKDGAIVITTK